MRLRLEGGEVMTGTQVAIVVSSGNSSVRDVAVVQSTFANARKRDGSGDPRNVEQHQETNRGDLKGKHELMEIDRFVVSLLQRLVLL